MVRLLNNSSNSEHVVEDFTEEQYGSFLKRHCNYNQRGSTSGLFTSQPAQYSQPTQYSQSPFIQTPQQFSQQPHQLQFSQPLQEFGQPSQPFGQSLQQFGQLLEEFVQPPQQFNPPDDEPSPLGLRLTKSPSLVELVQKKLAECKKPPGETTGSSRGKRKRSVPSNTSDKLKASNFPASLLRIGTWEYVSRYEGDLVAKCYFAKHKLVWEVLDGGLKNKIEMQWSDIVALKAHCSEENPCTLTIVLAREPIFFRETNPQPRKHTLWQASTDFTDGQATINRIHYLECPPGMLTKHYEKLIQCDTRLGILSQQPEKVLCSPLFESQTPVGSPEYSSRGDQCNQLIAGNVTTSPDVSDAPSADSFQTVQLSSFGAGPNPMARQYMPREVPSSSSVMAPSAFGGSNKTKGPNTLEPLVVPGPFHSNSGDRYNQLPTTVISSPSSVFEKLSSVSPVQLPPFYAGHSPMVDQYVYRENPSTRIQGSRNVVERQERLMARRHQHSSGGRGCYQQLQTTAAGTHGSGFQNSSTTTRVTSNMQLHSSSVGPKPFAAAGMSREASLFNQFTMRGNPNFEEWQKNSEGLAKPGFHSSGSVNSLLDNVEDCIIASENFPCQEMLDNISEVLLGDTQQTVNLDERSLMRKVNSLCCLLDDPIPASVAPGDQGNHSATVEPGYDDFFSDFVDEPPHENASNFQWDAESYFADGPSTEMAAAPGLQRKDSFVEMLYDLPRIASLPRFESGSSKGY